MIPAGVSLIDAGAFSHCQSLKEFHIDDSNACYSVRDGVLYSKDGSVLEEFPAGRNGHFDIPDGVEEIVDEAFAGSIYIISLTIPDGVERIGADSFVDCQSLASINIPKSVERIDEYAFAYCSSLADITFEGSVPSDGEYSFRYVSSNVYYPCLTESGGQYQGNLTWIKHHRYENHICKDCGMAESGYMQQILTQDYLMLEKGHQTTLDINEFCNTISDRIVWLSDNENVAAVDGSGCVTAIEPGTANITASAEIDGEVCSAVCRIDVVEEAPINEVSEIVSSSNKLDVELYKTDYTQIDILPVVEQNLNDIQKADSEDPGETGSGFAVVKAEFTDELTASVFDLRVKDDRSLLVVPKEAAVDGSIKTGS